MIGTLNSEDRLALIADGREIYSAPRVALQRDFETSSQQNDYLVNRLLFSYEHHEDIKNVFDMRPLFGQLTAPAVRDAARSYLNTERYVHVTLLPEAR